MLLQCVISHADPSEEDDVRWLIATALLFGLAGDARADQTVVLLDNTKLVGKVLHYYDGQLTLQLPNNGGLL